VGDRWETQVGLPAGVANDTLTEQSTLLAALLLPSRPRWQETPARAHRTKPFFRIRGIVGHRLVAAEWVGGRLRADEEVREAAERVARCTLVDEGPSFRASLRRRVDAMETLLRCFDEVTHAQAGLDIDARPALQGSRPQRTGRPVPPPSRPARADSCPVCASRATSFEYHAANWCPAGSPSAHIHRRCASCGHVWYEAP